MAHCVVIKTTVEGDAVLVVQPAVTDYTQCAYLIETPDDYNNWKQLMSLSLDDAQVIAPYIGLVWATAWGFRAIRMALFSNSNERQFDE